MTAAAEQHTTTPLSQEETRAMMLLRANSLAKGCSGVRPEVIDLICAMLNQGVHPVIPSQGSVGASGDLADAGQLEQLRSVDRPAAQHDVAGADPLRAAD